MQVSSAGVGSGMPNFRRSGRSSGKMHEHVQSMEAARVDSVPVHSDHHYKANPKPSEEQAAEAAAAAASGGKSAFDPNGPVEAVALQSDWQFWNTFSDVRTIGKGHFAKVKQVVHNETNEHFAAKILDKALADNDIEDLVGWPLLL